MLDLSELSATNPIYHPGWTRLTILIGSTLFKLPPSTRLELDGLENVPSHPAIISPNHTHKFDFFPIRSALLAHDIHLMTWIKARDYRDRAMAAFFSHTGNIPLASRGYLIAADFAEVLGRPPTEAEYRALRDHVDLGSDADEALLEQLSVSRTILGATADPAALGYAQAVRLSFYEFMNASLRLAEVGRDAGHHQHIYPQGATSKQLTPGKSGAVQAALALGVPIVPVGISGCREAFKGSTPFSRGGSIRMRIGKPFDVPRNIVPDDFRAYHPDDEATHRDVLQQWTDTLMDRINELCDPQYQWAPDLKSDAKQGVARFYA